MNIQKRRWPSRSTVVLMQRSMVRNSGAAATSIYSFNFQVTCISPSLGVISLNNGVLLLLGVSTLIFMRTNTYSATDTALLVASQRPVQGHAGRGRGTYRANQKLWYCLWRDTTHKYIALSEL